MTHKERKDKVDGIAEEILVFMNGYVYETSSNPDEERERIEYNQKLVRQLIAAARALGRDFSDVIR